MPAPSRRLHRSRSKGSFPCASRIILLSSLVVVFACISLVGLLWTPADALSLRSKSTEPAFSLVVTLTFSSEEYKEQLLRDIQPVADYVKAQEPTTLAYEVLLSDQDPLQVLILERYKNKDVAYLEVHKSSAPFLAFRSKLQALQEAGHVTISGHSYLDSAVGFGDRTQ